MNRTLPGHANCHHRQYGLSCQSYEQMLAETNQSCEVCRSPAAHNTAQKLFIDHDESVGRWAVRGLLCHRCNSLIADRPGWNVTAPEGAERYLADPWYLRRVAELGLTITAPAEPLRTAHVLDPHGRTWIYARDRWRTRGSRVRGHDWIGLAHQFGPIGLTIIDSP